MKKVRLGRQGLEVPAVGLGCMGMSDFYGDSEQANNLAVLDRAIELGCTFWDTADMYGPFTNEELLGKALKGRRDKVTVATKFGIDRADGGFAIKGSPEYVRKCCEASLGRLGVDHIDLYYQHRVDESVPIEETAGAMGELVREGKVRAIGLSEASAEQIEKANGEHPITALQTEYSLWERGLEAEILPTLRRLGISLVAYSPLGRGFLTGAIKSRADLKPDDWRLTNPRFTDEAIAANSALVEKVAEIAAAKGVTPAQLALAWVLAKGDDIACIPGTRRIKYLEQNWASQQLQLEAADVAALDALSGDFAVVGDRY